MVSNLNINNMILAVTTAAAAAGVAKAGYKAFNAEGFKNLTSDVCTVARSSLSTLVETVGVFAICNVLKSNAVSPMAKVATASLLASSCIWRGDFNYRNGKEKLTDGIANRDAPLALKGIAMVVGMMIPALVALDMARPMLQR